MLRKPASPKSPKTPPLFSRKEGVKKTTRRYTLNEDFFDKIDSADKAYFLGLLFSDGSVCDKNAVVTISLCEYDKHILVYFRDILYPLKERPLKYVKSKILRQNGKEYITTPQYRLDIHSRRIVNTLSRYGCVPDKSAKIRFPSEHMAPEFYRDFIRGYFDGDGCVAEGPAARYKSKIYRKFVVSFCCNRGFAEDLAKILRDMGVYLHVNHHKVSRVESSKMDTISHFWRTIWYPNCTCLDRKRKVFQQFLEKEEIIRNNPDKKGLYKNVRRDRYGYSVRVQKNGVRYYLGNFEEPEPGFLYAQMFQDFQS